jgi:hypothetical protein
MRFTVFNFHSSQGSNGGGERKFAGRSPLAEAEIEEIWMKAAAHLGWMVVRTDAAYASSDGHGTITIGTAAILDEDDAVAQLIFHELCHGLVEGGSAWRLTDWGLSNCDDQDVQREHACLRVQIAMSAPFGLRALMAPTTEYRRYHDEVVGDPLTSPDDVAAALARQAVARPETASWRQEITAALEATRRALSGGAADPAEVGGAQIAPRHRTGFELGDASRTCAGCAWIYVGGRGRGVHRCRQSAVGEGQGARTEPEERACVRWEPPVACQHCGACCREAYHSVTVAVRDPVVWKHPELVVRTGPRFEIRREGERCAALQDRRQLPVLSPADPGDAPLTFSCSIYADRPRPCREFEAGGRHCLVARRRVGLSPHDDHR